jgi:copper resistance protein D
MDTTIVIWIHLTAAITWIGGMVFHRLVLRPAIANLSSSAKGQELLSAVLVRVEARYKTLRWLSLATLLVTGMINLLNEGGSARMESTWGAVLMLKLFFVLIVLGLTAIQDVGMPPARPGATGTPLAPAGRASVWMADTLLALGLIIVLIAAYLVQS